MSFAIVADLPLGTYRGASADGTPEPVPSVSRLYSALLCAAGFGPRAVVRDLDSLDVSDADEAVLHWLESNPPDSVHLPALEVNVGNGIAYRDDGTLKKAGKSGNWTVKKLPKAPNTGTAVDGRFAWIWDQAPPEPVRVALEQLCPDVAYLGASESPVRLNAVTADAFEATHDLDPAANLFTVGGTGIERPVPGRLAELTDAHRVAAGTPPSVAKDRYGTDEKSLSPVPQRKAIETVWYSLRQARVADVPWPQVITISTDAAIPVRDRVAWAVAAHRAFVKLMGFGAPAIITGAYPEGVPRPANRVALHFIDQGMPASVRKPCLAILVPTGTDQADLDVLRSAVGDLTSLRGPRGKLLELDTDKVQVADGSRFWREPLPGHVRLWRTVPAAIPDTRGSRGSEWNFAHAALLSLGFVWKGHESVLPKVSGRGPAYYRGLASAASTAGAAVVHARAIRAVDVDRYVHKVHEHAVVRPYTACLSLGSLTGPCTIQAIGQSRHLGGGLLVPFDVPEGVNIAEVALPGESGE